ncbi:MAG: M23 family peptidase, partial [Treponema sp.]|nr:M23 family peptidase [Treponema sp.]
MIVPHSQSKVLNFQTNIFALVSCAVIVAGVLFSFIWFNKTALTANAEIARLQAENKEARAGLDELRDEN